MWTPPRPMHCICVYRLDTYCRSERRVLCNYTEASKLRSTGYSNINNLRSCLGATYFIVVSSAGPAQVSSLAVRPGNVFYSLIMTSFQQCFTCNDGCIPSSNTLFSHAHTNAVIAWRHLYNPCCWKENDFYHQPERLFPLFPNHPH